MNDKINRGQLVRHISEKDLRLLNLNTKDIMGIAGNLNEI